MANLKDISRQISSVTKTQKTTKAMKLVSTAKLRKARQIRDESIAYSQKISEVLSQIAMVKNKTEELVTDRIFAKNDKPKNVDIVIITADKGLCGSFNHTTIHNVIKCKNEYEAQGANVRLLSCGKKSCDYFKFNKIDLSKESTNISSAPTYELAEEFIEGVFEDFNSKKTDKVILIYNGFKNMLIQEAKIKTLLPIEIPQDDKQSDGSAMDIESSDSDKLLQELADKYIVFSFYYALLDSLTAEHSARMQAMDNAVKNAGDKKDELTIFYNKTRQAAITTELVEIISGVESLK